MRSHFLSALVLALLHAGALAQSFNIDLNGGTGSAGAGVPAATFGAAANQPGTWNNAPTGVATAVPLVNLAGTATSATLTRSSGALAYSFNNTLTTGDFELLMDDIDCPPSPFTYTLNNLIPGAYRVYTYGLEPCGTPTFL